MITFTHPEFTVETMRFEQACEVAGITCTTVSDDESGTTWRLECCGELCSVGSGICGGDVVSCDVCKASVANLASPHINGGHVYERLLEDPAYETCWLPRAAS